MSGEPLLQLAGVEKLRVSGASRFHLRVEAFALHPGERVALCGASGSGKSTLLDLLALVLPPEGAERFTLESGGERHDLAALWRAGARDTLANLRGRLLGYVLQTGGLLPFLSVGENITLPRRLLGLADGGEGPALARSLGIAHLWGRPPAQLSVGERQRVAIARALSHQPAIVLADEPTSSLDDATADRVLDQLVGLSRERGAALVVASHDRERLARFDLEPLPHTVATDPAGESTLSRFGGEP